MRIPKTPERCLNLRVKTSDTLRDLAIRDQRHIKVVAGDAIALYHAKYPTQRDDIPRARRDASAINTIVHATLPTYEAVKGLSLRDNVPVYQMVALATDVYAETYKEPRAPEPRGPAVKRGRPPMKPRKEPEND